MRRRMRNFDPMQGAGEECGTREKMREARVRMTMVGRGRHELAAHHRRLHTVLLVSGPRIPLLHSASGRISQLFSLLTHRRPMFLDRDHSIAKPGFSRWRVPPAALAIPLAIGQAYPFSVFNLPLSTLVGGEKPAPTDWKLSTIGWIFSTAIVFLGLSAFTFGRWLEEAGPRKAMFCSAMCFGGGFMVGAFGVHVHQIWIIYLGYGVIGGIGLGLGYISPVSTLIKWFPDRPGMATGLAIMGFGGGAMIGSPLAGALLAHFKTPASAGVVETFLAMGALYFVFMMFGVFTVRLPAPGWAPAGWNPNPGIQQSKAPRRAPRCLRL